MIFLKKLSFIIPSRIYNRCNEREKSETNHRRERAPRNWRYWIRFYRHFQGSLDQIVRRPTVSEHTWCRHGIHATRSSQGSRG